MRVCSDLCSGCCSFIEGPPAPNLCCVQVFGCRKKMSAIAILDISGAEHLLRMIETLAAQGCAEWRAQCAADGTAPALLPEQVGDLEFASTLQRCTSEP